jgi:hypothetical protein
LERLLRHDEIKNSPWVFSARSQASSSSNNEEAKASDEPPAEEQTESLEHDSETKAFTESVAPTPRKSDIS